MSPSSTPRTIGRGLAAGLALSATLLATTMTGSAAHASTPSVQSASQFLDGTVGGKALESLVDLPGARASSTGPESTQNPLDATLLNSLKLPLTNALKLPGGGVFALGAANQVAQAKSDGWAYGASGAVNNSGGVSVGGNDNAYPADASVDLSADAVTTALGSALPTSTVPGAPQLGSLASLGQVQLSVGAVSALAQSGDGGTLGTPEYNLADLKLQLSSPLLGGLLATLTKTLDPAALTTLLGSAASALGSGSSSCSFTSGQLPATISLDNGAVVIDPADGGITVDLAALLATLKLNLNALPPNTDLIDYVVSQLPTVLTTGLGGVVDGIVSPLEKAFAGCLTALGPLGSTVATVLSSLSSGEQTLESTLNTLAATLSDSGKSGLTSLASALKKLVDVGVNVQPEGAEGTFTSALAPSINQAAAALPDQRLVRAVEIDLIGDPAAVVALANAVVSAPATTKPSSGVEAQSATQAAAGAQALPTGVPAGYDPPAGHSSDLVPVLLVTGLLLGAAGAVSAARPWSRRRRTATGGHHRA